MVATRPDLSNAVSIISQFMQDPSWVASTRILRYLQGIQDLWLQYSKVPIDKVTSTGFSDSDWGGEIETRRPTTGFTFLLANGAVSWMSKKQPTMALLSTKAEYMPASSATREAIWLRRLLFELGFAQEDATRILTDS